jgi:PAT family acetyl-CoA transporter-like MFS transporter 1
VPLALRIIIVLILYILQGVILGLIGVIPLYLASSNATWKQHGILSFVMYPFSLKLLWAPIIDVFYIRRLGRRQTWLLPIQVLLGGTLILLSFYIKSLLDQLRVTELTIIMFFIVFLTATQDICVDGWALTLFSSANVVWQSISQMIGQPLGGFLGFSILLTFESANQTNRFVRQPLGIAEKPYGLFTLAQFVRFWGVSFLVATCAVSVLFRERQQNTNTNDQEEYRVRLNLLDTYLYTVRLFKKKCFRQLTVFLLGPHIGHTPTSAMTSLMLIRLVNTVLVTIRFMFSLETLEDTFPDDKASIETKTILLYYIVSFEKCKKL